MRHAVLRGFAAAITLFVVPTALADSSGHEVVCHFNFEVTERLELWEGLEKAGVKTEIDSGGSACLLVDRAAEEGAGSLGVRTRLPLDKLRGARVRVEARVRAENVAKPPNPWNGIECMLHTVAPDGQRWQQQNNVFGSFDWKTVRFVALVPEDATQAWLVLGLELTSGRVWFDDVKITVIGRRRKVSVNRPIGPVYKGHDLDRLRGAMIGHNVTEDELRLLGGQWKANHVRWQLIWGGFPHSPADKVGVEEYNRWLDSTLSHLDRLLPVCRQVGIKVLIDLHTPPGGRNDANECRIFKEERFQEAFVAVWEKIARRYRGNQTVWGYDLVNEPVEGAVGQGLMDWHALVTLTARKVRAIDADHAIVVEPAPWGSPQSLEWFEPIDVPDVVYSVHMYQPHQFTHQGIYGNPTGIEYPGMVDGQFWDQQQLRLALKPALDYQRDYGVHLYIGEFSAIRWAPADSGHDYLRDCIAIFEEYGWDWAYHAFREWDGWSVEHGPNREDRSPASTPTKREQLLRSWFEKNRP